MSFLNSMPKVFSATILGILPALLILSGQWLADRQTFDESLAVRHLRGKIRNAQLVEFFAGVAIGLERGIVAIGYLQSLTVDRHNRVGFERKYLTVSLLAQF